MNDTYGNFKKIVLESNIEVPNVITEEWLKKAFENEYFSIWGFSFNDLRYIKFGNINDELLSKISFSTKTILPKNTPIKMEEDMFKKDDSFSKLHEDGINGEGINVAVIDYGFHIIHDEIKDNLIKIINTSNDYHFHGSVVSSIFVGKDIGVCPKSKLYFYECSYSNQINDVINALKDIYKLNESGANIRVVNISASLHRENSEFEIISNKLKGQGCYVIDSITFGEHFTCINKCYKTNKYYYNDWQSDGHKKLIGVLRPTYMLPFVETEKDYQYKEQNSYSWVIPVISGMFTLALQINPNLTYDEFVEIAEETKIINEDGIILLNPVEIIKKIVKEKNRINKYPDKNELARL